uniref:Uncharacterized protein n=1 Tax=Leersia perrieri TaxID=77586 RepID=A0A0D9VZL2_9ORYZ
MAQLGRRSCCGSRRRSRRGSSSRPSPHPAKSSSNPRESSLRRMWVLGTRRRWGGWSARRGETACRGRGTRLSRSSHAPALRYAHSA